MCNVSNFHIHQLIAQVVLFLYPKNKGLQLFFGLNSSSRTKIITYVFILKSVVIHLIIAKRRFYFMKNKNETEDRENFSLLTVIERWHCDNFRIKRFEIVLSFVICPIKKGQFPFMKNSVSIKLISNKKRELKLVKQQY